MVRRINRNLFQIRGFFAGQNVKLADFFNLVAEERHPPPAVFVVRRKDIQRIALNPERGTHKIRLIALILQQRQIFIDFFRLDTIAFFKRKRHRRIRFHASQTVNARHRRHDNHVFLFQNVTRRPVPHPVNLLVNRRIFFNIGISLRNICFRLIIVVVGYEILNMVVRKKLFHLRIQLRRKNFVRRHNQRRLLHLLNDFGHGKGLARTGNAQQNLVSFASSQAVAQLPDCFRLVSRRLKRADHFKLIAHRGIYSAVCPQKSIDIKTSHSLLSPFFFSVLIFPLLYSFFRTGSYILVFLILANNPDC